MNKYLIKDLMNVNRGSSPRPIIEYLSESGYRWLKISDFNLYDRFVYETKEFIKESGLKNTRYLPAGTLILTNSATPGIPIFLGRDMCLHDGFLYFTNIKENIININYLYYWFLYNRKLIINQANGSVFKNLKKDIVENFEITVPDMNTQLKIVKILDDINGKLELNNKINNNLHELGKSIVINCENNSNNKIELNEITTFVNGYAFKNSDYNEEGIYKVITIKNVQDGYIDSSKTDRIIQIPNKIKKECVLNKGDVLLSLTGNVGRVGIVYETDMLLNQRVAKFNPKNNELLPYLYFKFLNSSMRETLENISKGTAQQNLSPVETLRLKVPFNEVMIQKSKPILNSIYKKIINLKIETKQLSLLRDELLPKLMNDEIDLDKIEI